MREPETLNVKGLCAASVAALLIISPNKTIAQSTQANPIEHCQNQSATKDDEIACLRAAIRALIPDQQTPPITQTQSDQLTADDPSKTAEVAAKTASQSEVEEVTSDNQLETVQKEIPTGLGAEQVLAKKERAKDEKQKSAREKTVSTPILDFAQTSTGRLIIVLANGQVWGQSKGDTQKLNLNEDETLTAEISKSRFGGYKLRIPEMRRTIRVRRIQ